MDPRYSRIPLTTLGALDRYLRLGIRPGDFLCAVLENDLKGCMSFGDEDNLAALHPLVMYLYNEIPSFAWGSPKKVESWLALEEPDRNDFYRRGCARHNAYLTDREEMTA